MKLAKSDITSVISHTSSTLDGADIRAMKTILLGYYTPRDANWSYELHSASIDNEPILLVSRFGQVIAEGK